MKRMPRMQQQALAIVRGTRETGRKRLGENGRREREKERENACYALPACVEGKNGQCVCGSFLSLSLVSGLSSQSPDTHGTKSASEGDEERGAKPKGKACL